jgi:DNA-binding transcriptional regulator YdaS (Cro superfamily)
MRSLKYAIDRAAVDCGTKTALAEALGFSPQRLNDYQTGLRHMPYGHVIGLARLANIDPDMLWAEYSREYAKAKKPAAASVLFGRKRRRSFA